MLFFGNLHLVGLDIPFPSPLLFTSPLSLAICKASSDNHFAFLLFASPLSLAICKASSDNHFAFLLFFSFGLLLFTASYTIVCNSIHNSSCTLSTKSNSFNLFINSTAYSLGIWFKLYLAGLVVFPTFFSLSLNFAIRSWWFELQSDPGLVFANCIQFLHLQL